MNFRKLRKAMNYIIILSSLLFSYNNCSPNKSGEETSQSSSAPLILSSGSCTSTGPCEDQLMRFYNSGYQPFLVQNCATCHSTGPGKGQFAHSNLCTSYPDFMQVGYSKVSSNALSDSHNPPYSGPQHLQTVNELRLSWIKALSEYDACTGGTGSSSNNLSLAERAQFTLGNKTIPAMNDNEERRLEFNLTQITALKALSVPSLPNARFSVMIKKEVKGTNKVYVVHSPKIYNSTVDIHIKGLFTKINGRYVQYSTNFRFIDNSIRAGTLESDATNSLLSTGALIIAGVMSPTDQVGFDMELIEPTVIPPPPPPVQMTINSADAILASNSGFVDLQINLNRASSEVISFTLNADTAPICGSGTENTTVNINNSTCLPSVYDVLCPGGSCAANALSVARARSTAASGNPFSRFDWDYKFGNTSMVFAVGETTKTIRVFLSKDIRHEANRILTLRIERGLGNTVLGKSSVNVVFNKRKNPVPGPTEVTYSMLMNANNGILKINCNSCHNSDEARQQGGFDIADYDLMVSRGVLQPGQDSRTVNPTTGLVTKIFASKMFKRMNVQDPSNSGLTPMPRDGYLDYDTEISTVERWILNGAKNN